MQNTVKKCNKNHNKINPGSARKRSPAAAQGCHRDKGQSRAPMKAYHARRVDTRDAFPVIRPYEEPFEKMLEVYQWAEDERLSSDAMRQRLLPALESKDAGAVKSALKACELELKGLGASPSKDRHLMERRRSYLIQILDILKATDML